MRASQKHFTRSFILTLAASGFTCAQLQADDFATSVLSYASGTNPAGGFTNPLVALGAPARVTGAGIDPSAVTPFQPCFLASEIVSIGAGGSLTLGFDPPIQDDPNNPFGIDFLVFGNAFFTDAGYPSGTVGALASDGGSIQVTGDGVNWFTIPGAVADGLFPTMGFSDGGPYANLPGSVPTSPHQPVDPAWTAGDLVGRSYAELVEIYDGSAGGAGVDIAVAGLTEVIAVRIVVGPGPLANVEIDAIARVIPTHHPADINRSGSVDGADLAAVLSAFGTASPDADLDQSGTVDGPDLTAVLAGWTR